MHFRCGTLLLINLWLGIRVSSGQSVDATPFLLAPEPIKAVLAQLENKKLVIEGTRVLMHDRLGVPVQEVKQEFLVRYEIVYFSGLGLSITMSYSPGSGEAEKHQILVLKTGTFVINHAMKSVWLTKNHAGSIEEGFFWLPAQQVEKFGLTAELNNSDSATLKSQDKVYRMTVQRDGKNLVSVKIQEGKLTVLSSRSEFAGIAPLPHHIHREEFYAPGQEPLRTDDVTISLVPLREEDNHALAVIVPPDFVVLDYRVDPQAPVKRTGMEIGELLKD